MLRLLTALLVSLLLTLLLECAFAFVAGAHTPRRLLLVVLVNVLTNPIVVLLCTLFPSPLLTAVMELAAVLTEGAIYRARADWLRRPFLFSLAINAFSYLTGLLINRIL